MGWNKNYIQDARYIYRNKNLQGTSTACLIYPTVLSASWGKCSEQRHINLQHHLDSAVTVTLNPRDPLQEITIAKLLKKLYSSTKPEILLQRLQEPSTCLYLVWMIPFHNFLFRIFKI